MKFGILMALCLAVTSDAAVFYVATNGSDGNSGSIGSPFATLNKAQTSMAIGDSCFVRGGFYNCTNLAGQYWNATKGGIVLSNYPGETPIFGNQVAGANFELLSIYHQTNCGIFGITATNCQRTVQFHGATNCELSYCNLGSTPTNYSFGAVVFIAYDSCSNKFRFNTIHDHTLDFTVQPQHDSGSLFIIGSDATSFTDHSDYNLFEGNLMYHGGHDTLNLQAHHQIIRSNYFCNPPWISWADYGQLGGHRCLSPESAWNIIEWNTFAYAGQPIGNNGATGAEIELGTNIVRFNLSLYNQNFGLTVYGNKGGGFATYNHIYNNTVVMNALGQMIITNYTGKNFLFQPASMLGTNSSNGTSWFDIGWNKAIIEMNYATNTTFLNNILAYSGTNTFTHVATNGWSYAGCTEADQKFGKNWTNNIQGDPLFVSITATQQTLSGGVTVLGDPFDTNSLNFHLQTNSPCVDAGQFLTTITSASGSGTSFTVADPLFFYDGYGIVQGDLIQLQGQTNTARITAISYANSNVTVSPSLSWVNGQSVALAFNGVAPDMGAFETGQNTAAPLILVTPGSLAFGTTGIPFPNTLTLSVTNVGGGTLTGTASVNAPWTITAGASYSLAANAGQNVTVQFAPTATGSFSDSVVFTGGGGASIPVTGSVTNIITTVISGTTTISGTTVIK